MDNTSALKAVRRRWWVIVLLGFTAAVIGSLPQPQRVEEQVTRYTTGEVPRRVAEEISFSDSPALLASQVSVQVQVSVSVSVDFSGGE